MIVNGCVCGVVFMLMCECIELGCSSMYVSVFMLFIE